MFTSIFLASVGRGRKAQGGFLILLTCSGFGISLPNVDFMFLALPIFLIAILMKVRLLTTPGDRTCLERYKHLQLPELPACLL